MLFISNISSCSFLDEREKLPKEKKDLIERELIINFSKAIKKNPNNFFFYFERGKAKQNYGDFKGAINDFNYALKLNPDNKFIFYRANAKFDYGDYKGAIGYEKVIFIKIKGSNIF